MKQVILTMAFMLLVWATAAAQATSRDFNEIKRSQKYYYSDNTLSTAELSKEFSTLELIKIINDSIGFSGERKREGVKEVTRADLSGLKYLQMDRAHGVRVMAYCPKSAFNTTSTTNTPKHSEPTASAKSSESKNVPVKHIATTNVSGYEDWILRDIEKLKQITSSEDFLQQLSVMQSKHKIKRYGQMNDCRNIEGSFWAVFDDSGTLEAILGPGTDYRKNFMSGNDVQLSDYKTNHRRLLWFQFSK